MTIARFRIMRLHCHIPLREVAELAWISSQRLNQFETMYCGCKPRNPERLVAALETLIEQRRNELERVAYICSNERDTIFDYVKASEQP
jgi:predicted Zn-dependent peptidase